MKPTRQLPTPLRRDAWVEVNLGALESNARHIRALLPESVDLMAVLKADAYGHGAVMVLPTLQAAGVTMVGVAAVDEALQIRQAGLEIPILVRQDAARVGLNDLPGCEHLLVGCRDLCLDLPLDEVHLRLLPAQFRYGE